MADFDQEYEKEKKKGRRPDYKADGVGVWLNKTKEDETYLSIKLIGHNTVNAFKNKPKEEKNEP